MNRDLKLADSKKAAVVIPAFEPPKQPRLRKNGNSRFRQRPNQLIGQPLQIVLPMVHYHINGFHSPSCLSEPL